MPLPRPATPAVAAAALAVAAASLLAYGRQAGPLPDEAHRAAPATLDEVFEEVARLRLAGSAEQPIGGISGLAIHPAGRIAVADRQSHRVYVFGADGELLAILGGPGEGPGEFRSPLDVAFGRDGRLFVAEAGFPRITVFGPALALDTVLHLAQAQYAMDVAAMEEGLLAYVNAPGPRTPRLRLLGADGREIGRFHPSHPAYVETPYWSAATRRVMAASDRWIVAGGNLLYPLARYSSRGILLDSVGRAPSGWRQPPRPEPGAFAGPDRFRKFEQWRRTFTTIQDVAIVQERYLVVSHRRLNPEILAYEDAQHFADVYDLEEGVKLWTGIDLPGPVLAGGESLTILLDGPPGGWLIGRYVVSG